MRMIIYKKTGVTMVELHGIINEEDSQILEEELQTLIKQGETDINLDLSKVLFIASKGIESIVLFSNALALAKKTCSLINPQPKIKNALEQSNMVPVFAIRKRVTADLRLEESTAYCK